MAAYLCHLVDTSVVVGRVLRLLGLVSIAWSISQMFVISGAEGSTPFTLIFDVSACNALVQLATPPAVVYMLAVSSFVSIAFMACQLRGNHAGSGFISMSVRLIHAAGLALVTGMLIAVSSVPLTSLDTSLQRHLPQSVAHLYHYTAPFHVTSGYGLFRRMTGVGNPNPQAVAQYIPTTWAPAPLSFVARPEIIIEGYDPDGETWVEIPFKYKPNGNVSLPLTQVAPHQPRYVCEHIMTHARTPKPHTPTHAHTRPRIRTHMYAGWTGRCGSQLWAAIRARPG